MFRDRGLQRVWLLRLFVFQVLSILALCCRCRGSTGTASKALPGVENWPPQLWGSVMDTPQGGLPNAMLGLVQQWLNVCVGSVCLDGPLFTDVLTCWVCGAVGWVKFAHASLAWRDCRSRRWKSCGEAILARALSGYVSIWDPSW